MMRLGKQGGMLRAGAVRTLAALLAAGGTAAGAEEPPSPVLGPALEAVLPAALIRDLERGGGRLSASGVDGAPPRRGGTTSAPAFGGRTARLGRPDVGGA
jgi:hypothetical protein